MDQDFWVVALIERAAFSRTKLSGGVCHVGCRDGPRGAHRAVRHRAARCVHGVGGDGARARCHERWLCNCRVPVVAQRGGTGPESCEWSCRMNCSTRSALLFSLLGLRPSRGSGSFSRLESSPTMQVACQDGQRRSMTAIPFLQICNRASRSHGFSRSRHTV